MRQWRVGTFSIGILFIALGVLMLAAPVYGLSASQLIFKWWPVILIMLGLEILVYVLLSRQEEPRIKFDGFSIFIIIVILIFTFGTYTVTHILGNVVNLSNIPVFGFNNNQYSYKENLTLNAEGKDKLIVNNTCGNVQIEKGEGNQVEVEADIRFNNYDAQYAKTIGNSIIETTESPGLKISTNSNFDTHKMNLQSIDYHIKVPEKINVEVEDSFGNVTVENILLSAKITDSSGSVTARNIGGDLNVTNSFGSISIGDVKGKVQAEESSGNISFENSSIVENDVSLKNSFGGISLKIPKTQSGHFKASTNLGSINNSFNLNVKKDIASQTLDDTIGDGKIEFSLNDSSGSINIETY